MLCGGASRRMGRDKALLAYDGVAMAAHVAATLRAAGCDEVVAIGGDAGALGALGLTVVPDLHPGQGPLGGVLTALHRFVDHDAVAVVACDLPRLTPATVQALTAALVDGSVTAAVARTDRAEPTCAVWRPTAIAVLEAAFHLGERRVVAAAAAVGALEVAVPAADLANVNTPDDLPQ